MLASPYNLSWESSEFQITYSLKPKNFQTFLWRYITFYSQSVFYCLYLNFLLITTSSTYFASQDYVRLVFLMMWTVGVTIMLMNQAPNHLRGIEIVLLVNGTEQLITHLEHNHFHNPLAFQKSRKFRSQIMAAMCAYCVLSIPCVLPIFLLFRTDPWIVGSHFYKLLIFILSPAWNLVALTLALVVDMWWFFIMWGSGIMVIHVNFLVLHTFSHALANILQGQLEKNIKAKGDRIREILLVYRMLRLICGLYNVIFGEIYVCPFKTLIGACIVVYVVVCLRLANTNIIILGFGVSMLIVCGILLIVILDFMAMVNSYSLKLKSNLKMRFTLSPEARRMVRSFKVEGVKSGDFYVIKKITCLSFLGMVGNLTGSVLISFQM